MPEMPRTVAKGRSSLRHLTVCGGTAQGQQDTSGILQCHHPAFADPTVREDDDHFHAITMLAPKLQLNSLLGTFTGSLKTRKRQVWNEIALHLLRGNVKCQCTHPTDDQELREVLRLLDKPS